MKPRAFVVLPYGKKKRADGKTIDFSTIAGRELLDADQIELALERFGACLDIDSERIDARGKKGACTNTERGSSIAE